LVPSELTLEQWPVDRLIDYARNPRKNDHALGAFEHGDHGGLLAVLAAAGFVVGGDLLQIRLCLLRHPLRLGGHQGGFHLGVGVSGRQGHRDAPQGVVALGGDEPVRADVGDQRLLPEAFDHLLAGATMDVIGEPAKAAIGLLGGVFEDLPLGVGELDRRGHVVLLQCSGG
jgi:hypothetical protein